MQILLEITLLLRMAEPCSRPASENIFTLQAASGVMCARVQFTCCSSFKSTVLQLQVASM